MHFCSCVSHWNAALVCLTSQYSICSNTQSCPAAVVHSRLGHEPSGCRQDGHKMPVNVHGQTNTDKERIRKQLYMSCRGFSSAHRRAWTSSWMKFTCKLWTKARPSVSMKGGKNDWSMDIENESKITHSRESISNMVYCQFSMVHALPPVSLSSTRISSFSSLQGISGSSPITVKVASNSPSTRNLTRPLAKQTTKHMYQISLLPTQVKTGKLLKYTTVGLHMLLTNCEVG